MDARPFLHSLQVADAFFPVGAFAYSDGLEAAAASGGVRSAAELGEWMDHFVTGVFVPGEGRALVQGMRAFRNGDFETLARVDEELTALRPSAAGRAASVGVGRRLLALHAALGGDAEFAEWTRRLPRGNAPLAYAAVFAHRELSERHAALAFGYNRLAGIVSAGLRLIAIGQQQGQILLTRALEDLPEAVDRIIRTVDEPLRMFSPLLDLQQMNHRHLYSRLFRT